MNTLLQFAVTVVAFAVSGIAFAFPESYGRVYGFNELEQAREQAKRENKLVIVYFSLTNCSYCQKVDSELSEKMVREAYGDKYVLAKVSINYSWKVKALAKEYGIWSAPTSWCSLLRAKAGACPAAHSGARTKPSSSA